MYNLPPSGNFMVDSDINEPEDDRQYQARDIYEEFLFDRLQMDRSGIDNIAFHLTYHELEKMITDFHSLVIDRMLKKAQNG